MLKSHCFYGPELNLHMCPWGPGAYPGQTHLRNNDWGERLQNCPGEWAAFPFQAPVSPFGIFPT